MVAPGLKPVELAVQHVRKCGQRVPICAERVRERPRNGVGMQTPGYGGIFVDILVVVKTDEAEP